MFKVIDEGDNDVSLPEIWLKSESVWSKMSEESAQPMFLKLASRNDDEG